MTFTAGVVLAEQGSAASAVCLKMLACWPTGEPGVVDIVDGPFSLGHAGTGHAFAVIDDRLWAADVRLGERSTLIAKLGMQQDVDDLHLLARAFATFGPAALDHLHGDYVFTCWERKAKRLTVGRAPLSAKSLFYAVTPHAIGIATHPSALASLPHHAHAPDLDNLAKWVAGLDCEAGGSMFAGSRIVPPGEVIELAIGAPAKSLYRWRLRAEPASYRSIGEAGEALRNGFDAAVADACAGPSGTTVASLLSGGRDSAAVTTSAAIHLGQQDRRLLALTGVPLPGTDWPTFEDRLFDEGPAASATASRYANVDHLLCHGEGSGIEALTRFHRFLHHPWGNPANLPWSMATFDRARRAGASVLLDGTAGNLTISANGRQHLVDVIAQEGIAKAAALALRGVRHPRDLASAIFRLSAPALQRGGLIGLADRIRGLRKVSPIVPVLRQPYRHAVEEMMRAQEDRLAATEAFSWRAMNLEGSDVADPLSKAAFGFENRDPTCDRRVVELCLSVPPRFYLPTQEQRAPLYAAAFGDRVDGATVRGRQRGYQGADWFVHFPVPAVQERFRTLFANPLNAALFDTEAVLDFVVRRPTRMDELGGSEAILLHRSLLLTALATADFIDVHFPR